jgi:uncharacterized protein DUF1707
MDVRASDADRDATVNRLREAATEGRLTLEELTDRVEAAANAVMRSDLLPLTSDLPATAAVGVASQSAAIRGVGDVKRSGPWTVPAENSFRTWFWPHQARPAPGADQRDGDPHSRPCAVRQRRPAGPRGRRGRRASPHTGGPDQPASQLRDAWGATHCAHRRDVLRRHQSPPPAPVGEAGAPRQTHRVVHAAAFAGCRVRRIISSRRAAWKSASAASARRCLPCLPPGPPTPNAGCHGSNPGHPPRRQLGLGGSARRRCEHPNHGGECLAQVAPPVGPVVRPGTVVVPDVPDAEATQALVQADVRRA